MEKENGPSLLPLLDREFGLCSIYGMAMTAALMSSCPKKHRESRFVAMTTVHNATNDEHTDMITITTIAVAFMDVIVTVIAIVAAIAIYVILVCTNCAVG